MDDPLGDGHPKSRSLGFGRKKRLEYAFLLIGR
jgi:hypothetical protein